MGSSSSSKPDIRAPALTTSAVPTMRRPMGAYNYVIGRLVAVEAGLEEHRLAPGVVGILLEHAPYAARFMSFSTRALSCNRAEMCLAIVLKVDCFNINCYSRSKKTH